jgi:NTE family protein
LKGEEDNMMQINLRRIPFFEELPDDALEAISERLRKRHYDRGEVVFQEGEWGDALYLLESGQAKVYSTNTGQERIFAYVGPGGFIGELALLLEQPRSASVQMVIDGDLYSLRKMELDELLHEHPAIAIHMSRELGRRLVETTRRPTIREEINVVAVVGDVLAFASSLEQLGSRVAILNLSAPLSAEQTRNLDVIDAAVVSDEHDLSQHLAQAVGKYERVLISLPISGGVVLDKVLELADGLVMIGVDTPPEWSKQARRLWTPTNDRAQIDRIARFIARRTVGLALSSGGAKGIAHIGVLKVLLEENIPIDMIAGSSAGSLFGAMYCAGWPIDDIIKWAMNLRKVIGLRGGLWDPHFPLFWNGLINGRRTRNFLEKTFGHKAFAELSTPLYIVATDITASQEVIFDKGSVAEAVRASIGIPGVFVPWRWRNRYLVDGGIVNPVPVSVLIDRGADLIIASSVVRPPDDNAVLSSNPRLPNFVELMTTMMGAMESEILKIRLPQVNAFIHPNVETYTALDYGKAKELIEIGEEAARLEVPKIKEQLTMNNEQ